MTTFLTIVVSLLIVLAVAFFIFRRIWGVLLWFAGVAFVIFVVVGLLVLAAGGTPLSPADARPPRDGGFIFAALPGAVFDFPGVVAGTVRLSRVPFI